MTGIDTTDMITAKPNSAETFGLLASPSTTSDSCQPLYEIVWEGRYQPWAT